MPSKKLNNESTYLDFTEIVARLLFFKRKKKENHRCDVNLF